MSAAAAAPPRLSVNAAAAPSVTGDDTAATDTSGPAAAGSTAAVASLVSVSCVPPPSVNVTRTLSVRPKSAAATV